MFKIIKPTKDAYINSRVVKNERVYGSNTGGAGSLDLFKLYDYTSSGSVPNLELSRLLLQFDLSSLSNISSKLNFNCQLQLFDVYGGQPTPDNFTITINPLSRSFDEGKGRDVVFYADNDVCNFNSGSRAQGAWLVSGCGLGGGSKQTVDFITASSDSGVTFTATQTFVEGTEDLNVDVTSIVSATLSNELPNSGFRIAFSDSIEQDDRTYFVKRFASRTAYNAHKHPRLIVKYDDSIQDDTLNLVLDDNNTIFYRNYVNRSLKNLSSASVDVTGSNCIKLKLSTQISGGFYELTFNGSQHSQGLYSATFSVDSTNVNVSKKLTESGSISFTPIWSSLDNTVTFSTGSAITFYKSNDPTKIIDDASLTISVLGLQQTHYNEQTVIRVNIFDSSKALFATRIPVSKPGLVIRDVHYQIRDHINNVIIVPFDIATNSTRLSSDNKGMYFVFDPTNLTLGQSYVVDILINDSNGTKTYSNASPPFVLKQ
jgi:hypothetical protein